MARNISSSKTILAAVSLVFFNIFNVFGGGCSCEKRTLRIENELETSDDTFVNEEDYSHADVEF